MKTAVSVIVPCYNVAPYVDECMSGLAEQTLGPMEIICVDDGSTDGTLELLYRWREKDNRLRVILFFPACPPDVIPQRTPGGLLYPEKALGEVRGKTLLPSVFWCGMRP